MKDSVEMTANQFQQNISHKLPGKFLNTFSAGNFIKFSVYLADFLTVYSV